LLPVSGCWRAGSLDDKERNNRIVAKAYEMVDQGDFAAAVTLFTRALDTYPGMARPHLDLALVLHDHQHDYLRAIYHYNRYLELRPDSDKISLIQERVRQAESSFVAQKGGAGGADSRSSSDLLEENRSLRLRVEALQGSLAGLESEVVLLREAERQRMRADVIGEEASAGVVPGPVRLPYTADAIRPETPAPRYPIRDTEVVTPPTPTVARPTVVATVARPPVAVDVPPVAARPPDLPSPPVVTARAERASGVRRSYTVQSGDSLSKIAFKVYGDATQWRAIQDANPEGLGASVNVRVGQVLVIP
jgi:LysM repeat protein